VAGTPIRYRTVVVVGIDTGGTFTDFTVGERVLKVRSTPEDPARAVLKGLAELSLPGALRIVHGTTVATNALLTRSGARTAFVTTRGLEDLLEIGRQERVEVYAVHPRKHDPIVAPEDRFGVDERLRADGSVERPLELGDLVERVRASGAEAVAVCLLHAYRNPEHEKRIGEAFRGMPVSLSHRVANEFREFERAATTAANASLMPVLAPYILRLESELRGHTLEILQSNGGTATPGEVAELPVRTVLSGPAGGVVAAAELARRHGIHDAVSFDMGGTSTDVALISGAAQVVPEFRIGGLPLRVPVVDVHTVGAGGGSLVYKDALGALRVGPQSAGAEPGPACYGIGEQATVTDAHVVLGHLCADDLLAGRLRIDEERARAAVQGQAPDIVRVADATMERAIRTVTVRRGIDPRPCTLIAFGGAGGLHACSLADALGMRDVLVPAHPGTFSALGMVQADRRRDFVRTVLMDAGDCVAQLDLLFAPLREEPAAHEILTADARYEGQSHELSVPADVDLSAHFHAAHERSFGYCDRNRRVEVVNLRRAAVDPSPRPPVFAPRKRRVAVAAPARIHRDELDGAVRGPTVIVELTSTTLVPAGWRAEVLCDGSLLLEREA